MSTPDPNSSVKEDAVIDTSAVDEEPPASNERKLSGWVLWLFFTFGVLYTFFHLYSLNVAPLETWTFRILHVAGGLVLGFGLMAAWSANRTADHIGPSRVQVPVAIIGLAAIAYASFCVVYALIGNWFLGQANPPAWVYGELDLGIITLSLFGSCLLLATITAILNGWAWRGNSRRVLWSDWVLLIASILVAAYLIPQLDRIRLSAGTPFSLAPDFWVTLSGVLLILELTRRVAGLALVTISVIFIAYSFLGPWLPGFLAHQGYDVQRFFTYVYTDNGILGPTTAVSSTYIILFICFAAFLQFSGVGAYFVNFAFAAAGRARGGPAKVAVFASGLMGMINGTSAGNVVATGSLTIPLMKKVGYRSRSAGAIEAAASTGGQIMPPIMGAGAFIMAEITGIPYTELVVAALIPAVLYFASIYFMVDFEAVRTGMRGMRKDELPEIRRLLIQIYLFVPIIILIGALFLGYSVIRAGTLAIVAAAVVSWITPSALRDKTSQRMGPLTIIKALELTARMSIQITAVCACAGIIVGVISLTGVGARFSSLLLGVAESPWLPADIGLLLAMVFAMIISIILGMGMPTTAAYAVAASVVAPGLIELGIPVLVAHFFVFYFAVISAITPPVALASYAAAAISGSDPMRTSVTSFKLGLAAFIVPYMFFYSPAMLMEGDWVAILHVGVSASIGVYLLSGAVQGWYFGRLPALLRLALLASALFLISGGWLTDGVGIAIAVAVAAYQRLVADRAAPATE
ncbi:MAG: TRAP transporter fused permease subunit [Pseudomonadota bacterium]